MVTKKDVQDIVEGSANNLRKEFKKDLKDAIDRAIAEIIESISKVTATKEDLKEVKEELAERIEKVEIEVKDVKRQINDLKADTPTPQGFEDHEKRIGKLEAAVFPAS